MTTTESQFIHDRCLKVIRQASMHSSHWEMTMLDSCHSPLKKKISFDSDELPIVSFFAADGDWTLYTTHRLIGECDGKRTEVFRGAFQETGFGNFKQDMDSPRVTEAKIHAKEGVRVFLYESGYASMAPIHYFKFWRLKWPAWKETFRLETKPAATID